jgi:excisionase family DNA binding protein
MRNRLRRELRTVFGARQSSTTPRPSPVTFISCLRCFLPVPKMVAFVSFEGYDYRMSESLTYELGTKERRELAASLSDHSDPTTSVRIGDYDIALPPAAQLAVTQFLSQLAVGSVHVLGDGDELTTQEAADLLGLSRTFVVRLIDSGKLPAHFAGTHRRVRAIDALNYLRQREERLDAVAAINDADARLGIEYR